MLTTIRRIGNAQGVLIPKPLLQQVGLSDQAEMLVEDGALVLRPPKLSPRAVGWKQARRLLLQVTMRLCWRNSRMREMRAWSGKEMRSVGGLNRMRRGAVEILNAGINLSRG